MAKTRTILLTGASGKLGQALCRAFVDQGHTVVATTHREQSARDLETDLAGNVTAFAVDFEVPGAIAEFLRELAAKGLVPDAVVHNARSQDALAIGADGVTAREPFLAELTVDVIAPYELTMALAGGLKDVVIVSSMYGVVAANTGLYSDPAAQSPIQYSVAKAAQIQLGRELAVRLAPNVRVNAVAFGGIEGRVDDDFKARYAALCPAGRMLTVDEVVGPVRFLLSDDASGMTGHTLTVDGGWTAW